MSKLYLTETGRVIPTLCEELTTFRRVRKTLRLPATEQAATLYLLARSYGEDAGPLHVSVNGAEVAAIEPEVVERYQWYEVSVPAAALTAGDNHFELWAESTAMNAWSLALEAGHGDDAGSRVSDDGGHSWRNERMGYLNAVRAEYVVRVRLAEGEDEPPPELVFEDAKANPRQASLRQKAPAVARDDAASQMDRVRALSAWMAGSWEHTSSARATQYTPWDAETILHWGSRQTGHNGQRPIAFCVHFAVALTTACQAVGMPARCAALMGTPNGGDGHFVAEVWFDEYGKWVMVDPNCDAICWKDGAPLSIAEIQQQGSELAALWEWGEGTKFQRTFPHMVEFIEENMNRGVAFRNRSVWVRADLLSHPELSPPGHGSVSYCEADFAWEQRNRDAGFGMFRYFADDAYFAKPPPTEGGK